MTSHLMNVWWRTQLDTDVHRLGVTRKTAAEARMMVALRKAVEADDAHSVERIAHTLKGSCANMGTVGMETLCTELQEMGRSEELRAAPGVISRLEEELGRVRAVFEEELSKKS